MVAASVPVLKVEKLAVAYRVRGGEVDAVHNVSFEIGQGESFGLVGESGCGKSTVAWSIVHFLGANGYIKAGRILFLGQELVGRCGEALRELRRNQISMVYQHPQQALNPAMRIGDQLKETLTVHQDRGDEEAERRCVEMLDRVHMSDPGLAMRRYPHQLSGGQQQRVVIAMALLNNPALLIMDEPTTALDVTVEAAVLDLIDELRQDFDTAILFISHNLGVVARVCDQVGVMYAREIVERAEVGEIFRHPQHPYTQGLMRCVPKLGEPGRMLYPIPGQVPSPDDWPAGCRFTPRCSYARDRCSEEAPLLRKTGKDHQVRCHFAEETDPAAREPLEGLVPAAVAGREGGEDAVLQVEDLKTYYEHHSGSLRGALGLEEKRYVHAVNGVSVGLPKGKTLGIVGESGCGKSTLVKTLIGLERSADGRAEFMGCDLTQELSKRDPGLLQKLQMVFQNPDSTLNPSYTVGYQIGRVMHRFGAVARDRVYSETMALLKAVRLDERYYERYPGQLSGGEKQRVGIARAFASRPDLVLCDEPVSSLDVSVQAAILNLLLDIQRQYGTTMVFIGHDLSVVRFFSDYAAVMYLGQIMETGPAEAIYAPPYHPYTEALLSATPIPDPDVRRKQVRLEGTVPSALDPPPGCPFHTRCPRRELLPDGGKICETEIPPWRETEDGHRIFCHHTLEMLAGLEPVSKGE